MNTTRTHRHLTALSAAGLLALSTLVLAPSPAQASRLPADPILTVTSSAPTPQTLDGNSHAASMRTLFADLHVDDPTSPHC